jgi:hypothetical protein
LLDAGERPFGRSRIEKMFVHSDQARDYGLTRAIDDFCANRDRNSRGRADRGNFSVVDDHGLIGQRRRTRSVNHLHMRQHDHRIMLSNEGWRRGALLRSRSASDQQRENERPFGHAELLGWRLTHIQASGLYTASEGRGGRIRCAGHAERLFFLTAVNCMVPSLTAPNFRAARSSA